jgi:hypothetical protein
MQKVLMKHLAARMCSGHSDEACGAIQSDCVVPERSKVRQVAPGTAAEVEKHKWWRRSDCAEKGGGILRHVVIARSLPEGLRRAFVVGDRPSGERMDLGDAEPLFHRSSIGADRHGLLFRSLLW